MAKYILAIDEGTTSARVAIYSCETNRIVSNASSKIIQYYPNAGWVEHDANQIYEAVLGAIEESLSLANIATDQISAVAITNQRESIVAFNAKTGEPICRSICWQCRRTSERISKLSSKERKTISDITGLIPDAYFSASKMAWILENNPEAQKLAKSGNLRMGTIDSFLAYKLTGNFVTDTTNASRTMLFNLNTLNWDDQMLKLWNIPKKCLPKISGSDQLVGYVKALNNAPLCAIIGDQQSSLIGQKCTNNGDMKVTFGTGGFALLNTGEKQLRSPKLLTTVAYTIGGKTTFALEGSIYSACAGIDWIKNNLELFSDVSKTARIAEGLKDNGGVYFVPAFTGLGAPYWNSNCRASITGITYDTQKEHIVRAMLESMAYNTADIVEEMQTVQPIKKISADGGGSKNTFLLQFLADVTNISVSKAVSESTVLGAIIIAKQYIDNSIKTNIIQRHVYLPQINATKRKALLKKWHSAVDSTINKGV